MSALVSKSKLFLVILLLTFVSCGSDDEDIFDVLIGEGEGALVTSIRVEESVVAVGESTIARVEFTFSAGGVFDLDNRVVVVVKIPASLLYRPGTGEVDRIIDDRNVEPLTTVCDDGSSFVEFTLSDRDLVSAINPEGDADARLSFTLDSSSVDPVAGTSESQAIIGARARVNSVDFSCDNVFPAQKEAVLLVR